MRMKLLCLALSCPVAVAGPQEPLAHDLGEVIRPVADSRWEIVDGVLVPERGEERTYVVTTAQYSDVEITLEFKPDAGTNSGVFARCRDPDDITPLNCYEFNIWDAHPDQDSRTGAIVTLSAPTAFVETEDRWNTMRVRVEGVRLRLWVNDTLTNDIEDDKLAEGFIAFQYGGEGGMVTFRNIRIEGLP